MDHLYLTHFGTFPEITLVLTALFLEGRQDAAGVALFSAVISDLFVE